MNPEEFRKGGFNRTSAVARLRATKAWEAACDCSVLIEEARGESPCGAIASAVCRCIVPSQTVEGEHRSIGHSLNTAEWQQEFTSHNWQGVSPPEASGALQTSSIPSSHDIISFHDIARFYQY